MATNENTKDRVTSKMSHEGCCAAATGIGSSALLGSFRFFSLESFGNDGCAIHFESGEDRVYIKIPTLSALALYSFLGQYLDDRQPTDPRLGRMLSHPHEGLECKIARSSDHN